MQTKPNKDSIIQDNKNEELLNIVSDNGKQILINHDNSVCYPIEDEIICMIQDSQVIGSNRKYQKLYDRISWLYSLSFKLLSRFFKKAISKKTSS